MKRSSISRIDQRAPAQYNALRSRAKRSTSSRRRASTPSRVAVHGEGTLHAAPREQVVCYHHPDLPDPRPALPHGPRTTSNPDPAIPIAIVHPYSYRDSYRDAARGRPSLGPSASELPASPSARSEGFEPPTF